MKGIYKLLMTLFVLDVVLLVLSGVFKDAHGFTGVLGGIGWFGFLLVTLVLIVLAGTAIARRHRHARAAA